MVIAMDKDKGYMKYVTGAAATALFCGAVAFSGYSNALAGELRAQTEGTRNIHEIIRQGGETDFFTVDAKLVEEDGETVVKEGYHPFETPDEFTPEPVKVVPQDADNDGDPESEMRVYINRKDTDEALILYEINDTLAAYYFLDRPTGFMYDGRGSNDPDENFEQRQKGKVKGSIGFLIGLDDYLD